jgi:hypothetical protein
VHCTALRPPSRAPRRAARLTGARVLVINLTGVAAEARRGADARARAAAARAPRQRQKGSRTPALARRG